MDRTRRAVLKSAMLGAAATTTGVLVAPGAEAAAIDAARPKALELTGTAVRRLDQPDKSPGLVPAARAGDRCVVVGEVRTRDGRVGAFHADVVRLHGRGEGPLGGTASTMEQHLFTFADGTLAGSGTADLHGRGTFAVVGGTGSYLGSHGHYTADQRRSDLGGDGTAEFHFTIETRERA